MPFVSKKPKLKLSKEELKILRSASRSRTMPLRAVERAKMIPGYCEGDTISAIARSLSTNRQKVERTIDKALAFGIKVALEDLHRKGRPRSISPEARAWIISLACSKPKDYGYASELWTNRALTRHIRDNCLEQGFPELSQLSGGTVSKILSKSNIKPHKISGYIERRDPEFKIKYLDSAFPPEMKLVITLDNHSAHTSKETREYLLTVPNRFSFVFTPKHASWLNIIECFFSKMARSFLRGIRVSSKEELKERILKYFDELNQMPVVFKWKYKMDEIPGGVVPNVY